MKKHLSLITACTLALLSCGKTPVREPSGADPDRATVTVNIGLDQVTKSAYAERGDCRINAVQLFVFDDRDKLETDCYSAVDAADQATSVTLTTLTGTKTVYAILNHPRLTYPKDTPLSTLEERLSDLADNTATNLVMSGKNTVTVTEYDRNKNALAAPQSMDIYVKRLASMIVLEGITVDFSRTSLSGAAFSVKELYLKNVVGKSRLGVNGLTGTAGSDSLPLPLSDAEHTDYANWYNKGTRQDGAPGVTVDSWTYDCTDVSGGASTLGRCLFAYPNKTTGDSHSDTFDQRKTRLVMKAHVTKANVADTDTYYVFDLPVLVANSVYNVQNITITMLGKDSDDRDDDLQSGRITPTVTVDPWTGTTNLTYDF